MNFVTYSDLNEDIKNNIRKIPDDVDILVRVPRSGLLVANMLALYLNKPFTDVDSFCEGKMLMACATKK